MLGLTLYHGNQWELCSSFQWQQALAPNLHHNLPARHCLSEYIQVPSSLGMEMFV